MFTYICIGDPLDASLELLLEEDRTRIVDGVGGGLGGLRSSWWNVPNASEPAKPVGRVPLWSTVDPHVAAQKEVSREQRRRHQVENLQNDGDAQHGAESEAHMETNDKLI